MIQTLYCAVKAQPCIQENSLMHLVLVSPPEHCLDFCLQELHTERFFHIIITALRDCHDFILVIAAAADVDDGHF